MSAIGVHSLQSAGSDDDDAALKLSKLSVQSSCNPNGLEEKLADDIMKRLFINAAKAMMEIPDLALLVTKEVLNLVDKECKELTSAPFNSILRHSSPSSLEAFKWDTVFDEWKTTAPTFFGFLESASTSRWFSALKKERRITPKKKIAIGMAGATLLKERWGSMFRKSLSPYQTQKKKGLRTSQEVIRTPPAFEDHNYDSGSPRPSTENVDRQRDTESTATVKRLEPRNTPKKQFQKSETTECITVTSPPVFQSKNNGQSPFNNQPEPLTHTQLEPQAQPEPLTQVQLEPLTQPEPQTQVQPEPQVQTEPQAQPEPLTQVQSEPQVQPEPLTQAQLELQAQLEPQTQPFPTTFFLAQPSQSFKTTDNQAVPLSQQNAPLIIFTLSCVQTDLAQSMDVKSLESTTLSPNYNVPCSCQVCGLSFHFTGHLIVHVQQMHLAEQNSFCGLCAKNLESSKKLAAHLKTHIDTNTFCHICGKCFSDVIDLKFHIRDYHYVEKPHLCEVCGKTFRQGTVLREHYISLHLEEQDKPFKCRLCGKRFPGERHLERHQQTHTGQKPYQCENCGTCFRHMMGLEGHMRIHTGEKPYMCKVCGKRFRLRTTLTCHQLTHTGEKPYCCHVCGRCFSQSSSRKTHMKTHKTSSTLERSYKCTECGKGFVGVQSLKRHHRLRHNGETLFPGYPQNPHKHLQKGEHTQLLPFL